MNQKIAVAIVFLAFVGTLLGFSLSRDKANSEPSGVELGRQVYISEGCIHCHSQYSRPDTRDTEFWGPPTVLPGDGKAPVLIGNRRQGPDLSNVGIRRPRDWNRRHLIEPAAVTPGSRMPSYNYLFSGGNETRGEALLDYLASLVTETPDEQ